MSKSAFCAALGALGGVLASAFGGWDASLQILVLFMGVDYATGLVVAGVFHASPKSQSGALESRAGLKGLLRKFAMLLVVCVAYAVDVLMGTSFLRDAVVIAFIVNEALSILENAALMGVPIPNVILNSLEVLKQTNDKKGTENPAGTAVESADSDAH